MTLSRTLLALAGSTLLAFSAQAEEAELIRNGEYLARAADCVACHSSPGGKPFAGGVEFKLPFGSLFTPNITPDRETGIGAWSDEEFVRALQEGVGKDGKHYYPAFPYTSYTKMPEEDILAIKAYLFSLEPVHQPPRENTLSFPFNQRWGMFFWNLLFLDNQRFETVSQRTPEWNRGAYLVEGPGHCGECHTPRNLFQALDTDRSLAGNLIQGWNAYNISSDPQHGIGAWPNESLVRYLRQGAAPGWGVAGGPMAEVVEHSLRHLREDDLQAIAIYLKDTLAHSEGVRRPQRLMTTAADSNDTLGRRLFADACASCHRLNGEGNHSPSATLLGLKTVNDPAANNLLGMLLAGHNPEHLTVDRRMPAFGKIYSDQELAALTRFMLQSFGDETAQEVSAETVAKRRSESLH